METPNKDNQVVIKKDQVEKSDYETGVIMLAHSTSKIYKVIKEKYKKKEDFSKELEQIQKQCAAGGKHSSLLAVQTIVRLCDESIITPDKVQTILLPLLTSSR